MRFSEHLDGLILSSTASVFDYPDVVSANAQARGTADQLAALGEVFGGPLGDDEDWRAVWKRLLPLYFHRYDSQIAQILDESTSYSAAAWNYVNANCLPGFNTLSQLGALNVPTLVLGGGDDWITPAAQSQRTAAALPQATFARFEASGHFPFIEETDAFITTVRRWITTLK